jgi:hypothetical protein
MTMLSDLCTGYQSDVDQLDPTDIHYTARLGVLTQKLALDAAALVTDYPFGEAVALVQLAAQVVQWIKAESEDPDDLQRRYGRQQAVLDILVFAHALATHYGASVAWQKENLDAHRERIGNALRALVP